MFKSTSKITLKSTSHRINIISGLCAVFFAAAPAAYAQNAPEIVKQDPSVEQTTQIPQPEYNLPKVKTTGKIVFANLLSNVAVDRNQPKMAFQGYMFLAQTTRDPRYAELAYKVAEMSGDLDGGIVAAKLLKEIAPNALVGQDLINRLKLTDAYAQIDQQNYRPAYDAAKAILVNEPKNTAALSLLMDVSNRLGYDKEALAAAEKWQALEPKNPEAMNSLGYYLADKNIRLAQAEQLIKAAHEQLPNAAHVLDSMGWIAYRQGRMSEALQYLQAAVNLDAHHDALLHYGEVLWQAGEQTQALTQLKAARALNPLSNELRDLLERLNIPAASLNAEQPTKAK
jgi:tetratricopeptide (TPR) repeat protein